MEQYCITLQQAKNLVELGYKGIAQYWWVEYVDEEPFLTDYGSILNDAQVKYPAYHVGELGEILHDGYSDVCYRSLGKWLHKTWEPQLSQFDLPDESYTTEAQARGELLIYLVTNNLL